MRSRALAFFLLLTALVGSAPAQDEASESYQYQDEDVVERALAEVLSRPEFARLQTKPETEDNEGSRSWFERILDWLESFGTQESDAPDYEPLGPGSILAGRLLTIMAVVILVAVLGFVLRTLLTANRVSRIREDASRETVVRANRAPGEMDPAQFWSEAQELGARQDYRRAIQRILMGSMSTIERQGLIRYRRGLTNRDYLFATRGNKRDALRVIVSAFELVTFGRREATLDHFRACCNAFQKGFLS